METLKEYLELYSQLGLDERTIVVQYIKDKNLEGEYYPVLLSLMESQRKKMEHKLSSIGEIILSYNDCGRGNVHHKEYTSEQNILMDRWVNYFAIRGELNDNLINEVRENAPNMPRPSWCYIGLIDYIENNLNIKFKEVVDK